MATALTSIFGSEITVHRTGRVNNRQYSGFAGANGVTAMHLGTRGYSLVVRGTIRASSVDYSTARAAVQAAFDAIEAYLSAAAADYTHAGVTYYAILWDRIEPLLAGDDKAFFWTGSQVVLKFVAQGRSLL